MPEAVSFSESKPNKGHNPVNDAIQVQVLNLDGLFLEYANFRIARRLLNCGLAELVLQYPLAIKLTVTPEGVDRGLISSFLDKQYQQLQFLQYRKACLYGNYQFQAPDGTWMFTTNSQKVIWYLSRECVDIVNVDPPVLRFRRSPNGLGEAKYKENEYYKKEKLNICVVCGTHDKINRHHVMPYVYRQHMPDSVKNHSYHDVLLLCLDCHEKYEIEANKLKVVIADEFGIKFHNSKYSYDTHMGPAYRAARAIKISGHKMPPARLEELKQKITTIVGAEATPELIEQYAAVHRSDHYPNTEYVDYGKYVVDNSDIQKLTERWRKHFLETMHPQFMPEHWNPSRPVYKELLT